MRETENTDPIVTLRAELLRDLPGDIKRVRNAYRRAAQQAALLREAKDFNAHQAACKAALGHLEGLIKLLRWASEGQGGGEDSADSPKETPVSDLITTARQALAETK
ncbi:hypothetical protein [Thalassospira sp.]|uniref:hypothetical protein n=1 Tax=Thalassospira sp. TaxID=1912094 RepID=UPI000C62B54B|nr:hypothetical protein [Thalassospira sp.]MBC05966.1 hypothetical protein [Thalassospira sp.]|tara:strand:- start:5536 stop:5856 length:321 start_codon:yes stop_codon:yes gene_type:complete